MNNNTEDTIAKMLRDSEQRIRQIINTALDAVVIMDAKGIITEWNHNAEITFGWTRDEAVGQPMASLIIPPEYRMGHYQGMERYLTTGKATILNSRIEITALRRSGEIFPVELTVTSQGGARDSISPADEIFFTAFVRDITARVEAERAVREAREHLELIVESAKDFAIISMDPDGNVIRWNPGAEHIFGYAPDDVIGRPAGIIFTPEDQAAQIPELELAAVSKNGRAEDERWHIRKNGERFYASGIITAMYDKNNDLQGFTKIARDMTQQKRAEQDLIEARNVAEAANLAKSEFLANMSHEIRTPMNAIIGLSTILATGESLSQRQQDYIRTLQMSADTLLALINDLLDISKIEARSVELEQIPFSLPQLIQEVISMMAVRAREKSLTFSTDTECANQRLFIGDPTRLRQIILNLCSNAVKFTERGGIHVKITCQPTHIAKVENVCIAIEDTGIGIAADKIDTIFDKFIQADSSINRKYGGTGLGLAITKTLIEIMGGTITVDSTLGQGSVFTICLKLPVADFSAAAASQPSVTALYNHQGENHQRILLVEDYPANILVATAFLENFGYAYDVATNGIEAIEMVKTNDYYAVLMDVQMHGINGFETTRLIREYEKQYDKPPLHIIGMTAHALAGDRERCLGIGMNDYISKPFNPDELKEKLKHFATPAA